LMGYLPLERYQVSIGAGAVVEGQAFVEGHYLESLAFTYNTCRCVAECRLTTRRDKTCRLEGFAARSW